MTKNLMGKSRDKEDPYAIFEGWGPFGHTITHLLKVYQKPDKELANPYARWFVAVKSDMTHGSYDMGDSYLMDATGNLTLTYASEEFKEQYWDTLEQLSHLGGFSYD
tara:strand:- start:1309 stop:1629 length:321 start_codon:yes stop_codon:yes gene_type:complete